MLPGLGISVSVTFTLMINFFYLFPYSHPPQSHEDVLLNIAALTHLEQCLVPNLVLNKWIKILPAENCKQFNSLTFLNLLTFQNLRKNARPVNEHYLITICHTFSVYALNSCSTPWELLQKPGHFLHQHNVLCLSRRKLNTEKTTTLWHRIHNQMPLNVPHIPHSLK